MARKVQVILSDDLDDSLTADETVTFGLDGTQYEIDLAEGNADELRATLHKYVSAARTVNRSRSGRSAGASSSRRTSSDRSETKQAREWLIANGHLSENSRGRISAGNWELYRNRNRNTVNA